MQESAYVPREAIYLVRKIFDIDAFIHSRGDDVIWRLGAPPPALRSATVPRVDDSLPSISRHPSRKKVGRILSVEEEDLGESFPEVES
jgi:hypothetical protein